MSKKLPHGELIYNTIVALREQDRIPTRQVLSELLGLKISVVDHYLKGLKGEGRVVSPVHGVLEPVEAYREDRAVSATFLPRGAIKVEVGDQLLELSLREARAIGMALGGVLMAFSGKA